MYKGSSIFWYNAPFTKLIKSGVTQQFTLQTQSDADFECQYLMSNIATGITDLGGFTPYFDVLEGNHYTAVLLQIVDQNTGEQWFNVPTSVAAVCGNAQSPMVLPQTKLIARSTSLLISLTNNFSIDFEIANITFFGRKLYR